MNRLKIKWVVFFMFFVIYSHAQEQIMGFNLVKGATYLHSSHATSKISQQLSGNSKIEIEGKTAFTVISITDTVYQMDVVYKELSMRETAPTGAVIEISSKQESKNIMSELLRRFIDIPFQVSMSKYGCILGIKNLDDIVDKSLSSIIGLTDAQKALVRTQVLSTFGEKLFKGSFDMLTNIYSSSPVKPGSHWSKYISLQTALMPTSFAIDYELKSNNGEYCLIEGNGKIIMSKTPTPTGTVFDISGTIRSTIKVDAKTGWILEGTIKQHMGGYAIIQGMKKGETEKLAQSTDNEIMFSAK